MFSKKGPEVVPTQHKIGEKNFVKSYYKHDVLEPSIAFKQALLASRDMIISSQNVSSKWQRVLH